MSKIREWLKGKKTYLVCAVAIAGVAILWADGGVTNLEALEALVKALFGISLRAGIAKVF